jgi:hypothetical protein
MKSETHTVQQLFQDRRQYRVPFYQRAYVWRKETQWKPLWEDIINKAEFRREGDQPPPHFLGAIVLEPQIRPGLLRGRNSQHHRWSTASDHPSVLSVCAMSPTSQPQHEDAVIISGSMRLELQS